MADTADLTGFDNICDSIHGSGECQAVRHDDFTEHRKNEDGTLPAVGDYSINKDGYLKCTSENCNYSFDEETSRKIKTIDCSGANRCYFSLKGVRPPTQLDPRNHKNPGEPLYLNSYSEFPESAPGLENFHQGNGFFKLDFYKGEYKGKHAPENESDSSDDEKDPIDEEDPVDGSEYKFEYIEKKFSAFDSCVRAFFVGGHTASYMACLPGKELDCKAIAGNPTDVACKVPIYKADSPKYLKDDYLYVQANIAGIVQPKILDIKNLTGDCELNPATAGYECFAKMTKKNIAETEFIARRAKEAAQKVVQQVV